MRIEFRAAALCAAVCLSTVIGSAQAVSLTLADVLSRAREQAPRIEVARLGVAETRGRLIGAARRFQTNPEVDVGIGNRAGSEGRTTDVQVGIGQSFEPGSRRTARREGAVAAVAQSATNVDETSRLVLRAAAAAYYRAVYANERIRLLRASQQLAVDIAAVAYRRFKAGDIAVLDVNVARASLARARAEIEAAEAARALALGDLRQLLGLDQPVDVAGALASAVAELDLEALLQASAQRPELQALEAAVDEAEADQRLGHSFGQPEYGIGARYSREEGDQIVMGTMTVTLPTFAKGQELIATGTARATRLRTELDAARTRVRIDVGAAYEAYQRRVSAVRVLETDAIPGVDENERLATRSFDVGQLGLPELLLLRREILDTRVQHLDALLEAALARTDLDATAAILR